MQINSWKVQLLFYTLILHKMVKLRNAGLQKENFPRLTAMWERVRKTDCIWQEAMIYKRSWGRDRQIWLCKGKQIYWSPPLNLTRLEYQQYLLVCSLTIAPFAMPTQREVNSVDMFLQYIEAYDCQLKINKQMWQGCRHIMKVIGHVTSFPQLPYYFPLG